MLLRRSLGNSVVFKTNIVDYTIYKAMDEVVELLKQWTIIHSYIPYLAGFHVWDMVMIGAAVLYQRKRAQQNDH